MIVIHGSELSYTLFAFTVYQWFSSTRTGYYYEGAEIFEFYVPYPVKIPL